MFQLTIQYDSGWLVSFTALDGDCQCTCAGDKVPAEAAADDSTETIEEADGVVRDQHDSSGAAPAESALVGAVHAAPFIPHRYTPLLASTCCSVDY